MILGFMVRDGIREIVWRRLGRFLMFVGNRELGEDCWSN